jgi:hypothetical protein
MGFNLEFKGLNILFCLITLKKAVLKIITITHQFKTKADRNSKHSSTKKGNPENQLQKRLFRCKHCSKQREKT